MGTGASKLSHNYELITNSSSPRSGISDRIQDDQALQALSRIAIPKNIFGIHLNQLLANIENHDFQTKEMVKTFPYSWSYLYAEYYPDTSKIRDLEAKVIAELEKVYSKKDQSPMSFSVEEFWLIAMTLVDHVRFKSSENYMADSPFYKVMKELAKEKLNQEEGVVFDSLWSVLKHYNARPKKTLSGLSLNKIILCLRLETLVVEISSARTLSRIKEASSLASEATVSSVGPEQVFSSAPNSVASSSADDLDHTRSEVECGDLIEEDEQQENASFSLSYFDIFLNENQFTVNEPFGLKLGGSAEHPTGQSDLLKYFKNFFDEKYNLFESGNIKMSKAMPLTLFGNTMTAELTPIVAPQGFFEMSQAIAPKQGLVPYAFALYCCHLRSRKPGVQPTDYEQRFIEAHILKLRLFRDELNKIRSRDIGLDNFEKMDDTGLGDLVAPPNITSRSEFSALHFIYPRLNQRVASLESKCKSNDMLQESDIAWYRHMFSDNEGCLKTMISPCSSNKMIVERIRDLCFYVDENHHKKSNSYFMPR